jgi:hypothetical protein
MCWTRNSQTCNHASSLQLISTVLWQNQHQLGLCGSLLPSEVFQYIELKFVEAAWASNCPMRMSDSRLSSETSENSRSCILLEGMRRVLGNQHACLTACLLCMLTVLSTFDYARFKRCWVWRAGLPAWLLRPSDLISVTSKGHRAASLSRPPHERKIKTIRHFLNPYAQVTR